MKATTELLVEDLIDRLIAIQYPQLLDDDLADAASGKIGDYRENVIEEIQAYLNS